MKASISRRNHQRRNSCEAAAAASRYAITETWCVLIALTSLSDRCANTHVRTSNLATTPVNRGNAL